MRRGKIIAIEGLPGAGKTTIGEYLSKKYKNFKFVEEIIDNELKIKNQYYYLRSDALKYAKARKYANKGFNVLLDRSHLSTLAFNYIRDTLYDFRSYRYVRNITNKIIQEYGSPDVYIYIKTPIELGFSRKHRKFTSSARCLWNNKKFLLEMEKYLLGFLKRAQRVRVFLIENQESLDSFVKKIDRVIEKIVNEK